MQNKWMPNASVPQISVAFNVILEGKGRSQSQRQSDQSAQDHDATGTNQTPDDRFIHGKPAAKFKV